MRDETKLNEMGTHQFTRGTVGHPRFRFKQPPAGRHPRADELARRIKRYEDNRNSHAGLHRPGAIHSRGGRA